MQFAQGAPRRAAVLIVWFVGALWVLEIADAVLPMRFDEYGIRPRETDALEGIVLAPLLHAGFGHLVSNTVPLLVMGFFLALSGVRTFVAVTAVVWLVSGIGTWFVGQDGSIHVGASGIVFGWLVHLAVRGLVNRDGGQIVLGGIMIIAYGSILWGVLPGTPGVSWEAHLFGALGGLLAAFVVGERKPPRQDPPWA
ncbi:rhomboid family intramembrane serine protease [Aeromicrobium sp. CTD01-1L150]|uniref:rhomboid family intramembrane serine protease n=1 Tax=Aeromicrobium sp. CTD01-1L150 TaxID=3341830 RepID=UPI0035C0C80F